MGSNDSERAGVMLTRPQHAGADRHLLSVLGMALAALAQRLRQVWERYRINNVCALLCRGSQDQATTSERAS